MLALLLLVSLAEPTQESTPPPPDSAVLRLTPTRYELTVRIDYEQLRLDGTARITLRNVSDTPVNDVPLLLYRLMEVRSAAVNGTAAHWTQRVVRFSDFSALQATHSLVTLPAPLPPGATIDLEVRYDGQLRGYAETGMAYVRDHIDPALTILRDDAFAFASSLRGAWISRSATTP